MPKQLYNSRRTRAARRAVPAGIRSGFSFPRRRFPPPEEAAALICPKKCDPEEGVRPPGLYDLEVSAERKAANGGKRPGWEESRETFATTTTTRTAGPQSHGNTQAASLSARCWELVFWLRRCARMRGGLSSSMLGGKKAFVVSSSGWRGFTRIIYAAYVWLSMFIGCDFGHSVVKIIPLCTFICQLVVNRAGGGIKHGGGSEFTSDLWSRTYK